MTSVSDEEETSSESDDEIDDIQSVVSTQNLVQEPPILHEKVSTSKQTKNKRNDELDISMSNCAGPKLQILNKNTLPSFEQ